MPRKETNARQRALEAIRKLVLHNEVQSYTPATLGKYNTVTETWVFQVRGKPNHVWVIDKGIPTPALNEARVPWNPKLPIKVRLENGELVIKGVDASAQDAFASLPGNPYGVQDHPVSQHSDVTLTAIADNDFLKWDATPGEWVNSPAPVTSVNTQTGAVVLDTDDIAEGVTNLYHTNERSQDAVGAMLVDTATIDLTYTDATPELKADVKADSVTNALLANMAQNTIKGRITASAGDPEDLTATQVRTIINVEDGADVTDAGNVGAAIDGATAKATPVDADTMPLIDSEAGNVLKKVTWANIKATLKTYFDTLYNLYVHPNHTGDVTSVADGATTIANDAVTYAKIQNVSATDKLLGRATAGTGDVEEIPLTAAGRALIDDVDAAAQRTTLGLGTIATFATSDYLPANNGVLSIWDHYLAVVPDMTSTQVCTVDITTASTHRPVITHIRFQHDRGGAQQFFALVECKVRWRTGASASAALISSYELDYHTSGTPNVTLTAITNGIRLTVASSAFGNTMTQGSVTILSTGESVTGLVYTVTVT